MKVVCLCGHEDHFEMPFDDPHVERIQCTEACRRARFDRLERSHVQLELFKLDDVPFWKTKATR